MIEKREEGGDDIGNWSLSDLKTVIAEFISLNEQQNNQVENNQINADNKEGNNKKRRRKIFGKSK